MKQIFNELKSQPLMSIVTIAGTALAIFMIMVVVMMQQAKIVPISPESCRDRVLYITSQCSFNQKFNFTSAGYPEIGYLNEMLEGISGIEQKSMFSGTSVAEMVKSAGNPSFTATMRMTDGEYWKIYDHKFLAGKPYDNADASSEMKKVVITEAIARKAFDKTDAVGEDLYIDDVPYSVVGVVENVSPITDKAYSEIWCPFSTLDPNRRVMLSMILSESTSRDAVKEEIDRRITIHDNANSQDSITTSLMGAPYNQEEESLRTDGSNMMPDLKKERNRNYLIYLILLLIPAINISSMTRSRLHHRVVEIGLKRAFGATRGSIVRAILTENFIVTLMGGAIGLLLTVVFGSLLFDTINGSYTLPLSVLFNWRTFVYVFIFCFILNILSSGLPAWRASRINPVDALNQRIK